MQSGDYLQHWNVKLNIIKIMHFKGTFRLKWPFTTVHAIEKNHWNLLGFQAENLKMNFQFLYLEGLFNLTECLVWNIKGL